MPKNFRPKSSPKDKTGSTIHPGLVKFTQTMDANHFSLVGELAVEKGLAYAQDVIRIACAELLQRSGKLPAKK